MVGYSMLSYGLHVRNHVYHIQIRPTSLISPLSWDERIDASPESYGVISSLPIYALDHINLPSFLWVGVGVGNVSRCVTGRYTWEYICKM